MIRAVYEIAAKANEIDALARDIALEQTVEVPRAVADAVPEAHRLIGSVAAIEPAEQGSGFRVTIDYATELASGRLAQLMNLLYGNVSIKRGVRLVDVSLPPDLLGRFPGPRFGVAGVRRMLGVYGRPLLATALKPRGSSSRELAAVAGAFARGGGDVIKDDHNLVDADFATFRERVLRARDAIAEANAATGRRTLYLPNLMHRLDELEPMMELLVGEGIGGVLISPLVLGLETARSVAARWPLVVMAHPAFSGPYYTTRETGIAPGLLLGTLMRLAGCDASVFPNHGGRFPLTPADCSAIGRGLRGPLGALAAAWPAPAGGMNYERLPEMAEQYGKDTMFLIGGGLLGHSGDLTASTARFLEAIRERFDERLETPAEAMDGAGGSACEMPSAGSAVPQRERLVFKDFQWEDRPATVYKADQKLPFRGVARHELIGPAGEAAGFDLRYFEIEPGGFTSLERHQHTHTVVALRGEGVLVVEGRRHPLRGHDIGYVAPMQPHQLRNESKEPFGFFCIVDRKRDRPQVVAEEEG